MKILRAYKTELDPNNVQKTLFAKTAGARRFTYNWGLARRIEEYRRTGKSSTAIDQHRQLNALKGTEFPWMYDVSKCAPQEALCDLDEAYGHFFRRVKAGAKPGFPRFKSKHRDKPRFRFSYRCVVAHDKIRLPKIGWVRLKEKGYIPVTGAPGVHQLSVTVKGTGAGRWFVSVQCEVEQTPVAATAKADVLGIDLGLNSFATLSDGTKYKATKWLKLQQKRVKQLQRRVSRKVKGGSNRRKDVRRLNAAHFKIACRRNDFVHKLTSTLVKTKPAHKYVLEKLNVQGMQRNHRLAGAIADAGWGMFRQQLKYKAEQMGSVVLEADTFFPSSKMCSRCHAVHSNLTLADRLFACPSCRFEIDRDVNAAINLAAYEKYLAVGLFQPRLGKELPQALRKVTPVERKGLKQPRGSRNKTQVLLNSGENRCGGI